MKNVDSGLIALTEAFRITKMPEGIHMRMDVEKEFTEIRVVLEQNKVPAAEYLFTVKEIFSLDQQALADKLDTLWEQRHNLYLD